MRRKDWQERLNNTIEAARAMHFEWGINDCALFTARCVDAIVEGADMEATIAKRIADSLVRASYKDGDDMNAVIEAEGGLRNIVTEYLGEPVPRLRARPGDAVLIDNDGQHILGVVSGHSAVCLNMGEGIVVVSLDLAICAWRVG